MIAATAGNIRKVLMDSSWGRVSALSLGLGEKEELTAISPFLPSYFCPEWRPATSPEENTASCRQCLGRKFRRLSLNTALTAVNRSEDKIATRTKSPKIVWRLD